MNKRKDGLDIIRTIAIALVILIHALGLSIDGYTFPIFGVSGFARIYLRRLCFACVPLFLMLSGYLNINKEGAVSIWKKSFPHLVGTYLFWSILALGFDIFIYHSEFTKKSIIDILNYSCLWGRAWYMDLYFGVLMLMPFINKGWKALEKKEKSILLIVLFIISFVSKYISSVSSIFFNNETHLVVISSHFFNMSYLFYYLCGAYISEYGVKYKKILYFTIWQIILVLHSLYYMIIGYGKLYNEIPGVSSIWYDNMFLAIEAVLMFMLLYDVKFKEKSSKVVRKCFSMVSILSFDMYLCSYITDMFINRKIGWVYYKWPFWGALSVSFLASFILSLFISEMKKCVENKIKDRRKAEK